MSEATGEYELVVGSLDIDGGHVDNTVIPTYVSEVRERFLHETVPRATEYGKPVVRLELDYHAELFAGDRVSGIIDVLDVGTTSLTTEVRLTSAGEPVATARTVQVTTDPDTGEPISVPESWRAALS